MRLRMAPEVLGMTFGAGTHRCEHPRKLKHAAQNGTRCVELNVAPGFIPGERSREVTVVIAPPIKDGATVALADKPPVALDVLGMTFGAGTRRCEHPRKLKHAAQNGTRALTGKPPVASAQAEACGSVWPEKF